jgi:hypothetical protein
VLNNNLLSGQIPLALGSITTLTNLALSSNTLYGSLPDLSTLKSLTSLCAPSLRCGLFTRVKTAHAMCAPPLTASDRTRVGCALAQRTSCRMYARAVALTATTSPCRWAS